MVTSEECQTVKRNSLGRRKKRLMKYVSHWQELREEFGGWRQAEGGQGYTCCKKPSSSSTKWKGTGHTLL